MQRFDHRELRRFFVDLDSRLAAPKRITLIGGGALALGYGVANVTNDLDCFDSRLGLIEQHIDDARVASGLAVMMVESRWPSFRSATRIACVVYSTSSCTSRSLSSTRMTSLAANCYAVMRMIATISLHCTRSNRSSSIVSLPRTASS